VLDLRYINNKNIRLLLVLKYLFFSSILLSCLALLTNQVFADQFSASQTEHEQAFTLTDQDLQIIDEKIIWRSIDKHQTPLNVAAIKQLLPLSKIIETSVIGSSSAYLAKIPFRNARYITSTWYINPNANFVDEGIAFWQKSDGSVLKLADFSQFNDNEIPILMHSQAFSLTTKPYEQGVLWLYIEAKEYSYPLDLKIFSESAFYRHQFINNIVTYFAVAVMLTLALLALIIFFRIKQKITLTCAAYIGLMGIGWAAASGLADDVFSITWFNTSYGGYLLFPLAKAFACQFTKQLFNCERDFPKLALLLNTLTKVFLILTILMPIIDFSLAYLISHIVAIIWLPLSITIGFIMLKKNDFRAKYYLTGNLFYTITLGFYMLSHTELVDNLVYPELLVLTALAIDCICISLSLAEWLHLKQRDNNRNFYLARIDSLTGIGNRYALNEQLERLNHHFVIVFIDFDGIKAINDKLGHKQGDDFLITGATLMQNNIHKYGTVFRTGGDEFVWLFELKQATRIDHIVNKIPIFITLSEKALQKTWSEAGISYGVASSVESKSQSECLTMADERMYNHKKSKRPRETEVEIRTFDINIESHKY
jgi:diguanylate cyclase (GGDEF)-like protein